MGRMKRAGALLLYVVVCVGGWVVLALLESWVTSAFS